MTRFYSVELDNRDRGSFVCGNDKIDHYFQRVIKQDVKRDYAVCYVLVERESKRLAGFYTLSSSGVPLTESPPELVRKLPRYPSVPAVLIGWLARDRSFAGEGVGTLLLYDAFTRLSRSPVGHMLFSSTRSTKRRSPSIDLSGSYLFQTGVRASFYRSQQFGR